MSTSFMIRNGCVSQETARKNPELARQALGGAFDQDKPATGLGPTFHYYALSKVYDPWSPHNELT